MTYIFNTKFCCTNFPLDIGQITKNSPKVKEDMAKSMRKACNLTMQIMTVKATT